MTIFAAYFDSIGDFRIDQTIAMAVLREMAVCTLQPLLGMNIHHMHGLTGIYPRLDKFALTLFAPFFRIVGRHYLAICIQQIALAVALENATEIPTMAVIIRKLGFFQLRVKIIHIAQEIEIRPFPLGCCSLRIAVKNFQSFRRRWIFLLFGPHGRRVRFIIPHSIAEVTVQEDVRLMHVAIHAL